MSNEPEKELKGHLTAEQLAPLQQNFPFAQAFSQTNTYYDTIDFALKAKDMGLRIRQFSDYAEQTLKVPTGHPHDLREITDRLTSTQGASLISQHTIMAGGDVDAYLQQLNIPISALIPFATATTVRQIAVIPLGNLELDQTSYADGFVDYDVELEYHNQTDAEQFFDTLKQRFGLDLTPVPNKVARALAHTPKV
ncbi:CYTH domain-containing protein [Lacticaseibacillus brantae]|uniref:CYTH domain-containing protein n=1 Tax=Lacticaseibacillus brantae DSM 23927 TaxID=1423727 RepID=A0A0R2B7K7_9LACO|nr:CYTH domain-containing protein [Lacticaseibacillus brantae]KRM72313.1 hypothetical protein FC34_GL000013 [Lacticaseibacillus brantae DSM 23927]